MADHRELKALLAKLPALREKYDAEGRSAALTALLAALESSEGGEERYLLLSTLSGEYVLLGESDQAEQALQRLVTEFPEDALAWITFAEYALYTTRDYRKAASIIERAVQVAQRTGQFLRQAYNTRARIARKLGDYALLESTLGELTQYQPRPGAKDVRYEDDFLKGIPDATVDPNVINAYRAVVVAAKQKPPK
jgi:tetratricopeptide (TPR) repeat protein